MFFIGGWLAYIGKPLFEDPLSWNYSTKFGATKAYTRLLKNHKVSCITEILDSNYTRTKFIPPSGSLLAKPSGGVFKFTFGIVDGRHGVFVDTSGYKKIALEPDKDLYWTL